jgi:hypothetical protein
MCRNAIALIAVSLFLPSGAVAIGNGDPQSALVENLKEGESFAVPWSKAIKVLHLTSISNNEISFTLRYGEKNDQVTPERKLRIGESAILDLEERCFALLSAVDLKKKVARIKFTRFEGSMHFSQEIILSIGQSEKLMHRGVSIRLLKITSETAYVVVRKDGIDFEESTRSGGYIFQKIFGQKGLRVNVISEDSVTLTETY